MRIRRFQRSHDNFWIRKMSKRTEIPNGDAVKNWSCIFYESEEHRDFETDNIVGGTVPGLEEYRYCTDWKPHPETELLEMRNAPNGGTEIRGEEFLGTHDPRLPDYVPIEFTVPWTPTEIEAIWDGEPVPNKMDYTHDCPEISAIEARQKWNEQMKMATDDGFQKLQDELHEMMDNCDHDHVVESAIRCGRTEAYCEDCGKKWERGEYEHTDEDMTVVSEV